MKELKSLGSIKNEDKIKICLNMDTFMYCILIVLNLMMVKNKKLKINQ